MYAPNPQIFFERLLSLVLSFFMLFQHLGIRSAFIWPIQCRSSQSSRCLGRKVLWAAQTIGSLCVLAEKLGNKGLGMQLHWCGQYVLADLAADLVQSVLSSSVSKTGITFACPSCGASIWFPGKYLAWWRCILLSICLEELRRASAPGSSAECLAGACTAIRCHALPFTASQGFERSNQFSKCADLSAGRAAPRWTDCRTQPAHEAGWHRVSWTHWHWAYVAPFGPTLSPYSHVELILGSSWADIADVAAVGSMSLDMLHTCGPCNAKTRLFGFCTFLMWS